MLKKFKMLGIFFILSIILSACGTLDTPQPVGIGRDVNEYKRSPCACLELPQDYSKWEQVSS